MSIITSPMLLGADVGGSYQISRSLRFNSGSSKSLTRTAASAGSRTTWTWSGWVKRTKLGGFCPLFSAGAASTADTLIYFDSGSVGAQDSINWFDRTNPTKFAVRVTTQVFRDVSAWYHLVFVWDTNNATAADRMRLYVNGTRVTAFSSTTDPSSGASSALNNNVFHSIGSDAPATGYSDGYLADIYFIDGQALDPSSFTTTDATTGQLVPKAFSGSYGTNGWHLDFADNSAATATTLGKDTSGNGNNWTPNNLSVTAGVGNDSLVDTPTNYGTDTGAGGEVRGNYATWNVLALPSATLSNGNLLTTGGTTRGSWATIGVSSGKWYWEYTIVSASVATGPYYGFSNYSATDMFGTVYATVRAAAGGAVCSGVSYTTSGTGAITSGTVGIALDLDTKTASIYHNNTLRLSVSAIPEGTYYPYYLADASTDAAYLNTGQRAFAYTAPSGFKALCTTNLPAPLVTKPNTVMDVKLYTGNGGTQTISGLGFSPDFVWLKLRSGNDRNILTDAVRGPTLTLNSDSTRDEATATEPNQVTAYTSTGFSVGSNSNVNGTSSTFVAWCWDAGTSTVTNTQGSITSSVRANPTAGFSVVTYTGNGTSGATVGHGLGVAPSMLIVKKRSSAGSWEMYFKDLGPSYYLELEKTNATAGPYSGLWNDTAPTSAVFSIGNDSGVNANGSTYVCYAFAPVVGYSSFGSYTGNGSSDGPFVYTGFRPKFLLIKYSSGVNSWMMQDSARDTYNPCPLNLTANGSGAENDYKSSLPNDMLSNGFKLRNTNDAWNGSGGTYIYAAFAESPFNYARAR